MSNNPLKLGIIGFGNHVVKNIMPCFALLDRVEVKRIFVRNKAKYAATFPEHKELFTENLSELLSDSTVKVIYIATPISSHFDYGKKALDAGKHVWLEKPMTAELATSSALLDKAKKRNLFIGEVSMYQFHQQFTQTKNIVAEKLEQKERVINAQARFSIPELDAGNIRYQKKLGGGALLDVGYYPLSAMVGLFGNPKTVEASAHFCSERAIDLSGSAMLSYNGFAAHCIWAIGSAYHNELEVSFEKSTIKIPRAFSKPNDLETEILITGNFGQPEQPLQIAADDHFTNNFMAFCNSIEDGNILLLENFSDIALANARVIEAVNRKISTNFQNVTY